MADNHKNTGFLGSDMPQNKGYSFMAKHPIIPNLSIYNGVRLMTAGKNNTIAVECLDLKVTYGEMFRDAEMISNVMAGLGIRSGDIITVCMPNYYQAVVIFLACNRIGAVVTFLNDEATDYEVCHYLELYHSRAFFYYERDEKFDSTLYENSNTDYLIKLQKKNVNNLNLSMDCPKTLKGRFLDYHSLGALNQKHVWGRNSGRAEALILYTSGTTGEPKPVVLTNQNVMAAGVYLRNSSQIENLQISKALACVPFAYPYGLVTSVVMMLLSGKTVILSPDISARNISMYLEYHPNVIFGSPALLELIMRNVPRGQSLASVKSFISGGDFLTSRHYDRAREFFKEHGSKDVDIGNGSGNAETVSCGTNPTGVEPRPGTAGKVLTGTRAMIVNENTFEELPYYQVGMLLVSGKHVFKEYYGMPEKTKDAKITINGIEYFKTGTLGFLDEDGYFTIVGRSSRFYINSALKKVYMDYVQGICGYIDGIHECALVAVEDDVELFKGMLFVVPGESAGDRAALKNNIIKALQNPVVTENNKSVVLKPFEIPYYVEVINEIPRKQGMDKIDYKTLEVRGNQLLKDKFPV